MKIVVTGNYDDIVKQLESKINGEKILKPLGFSKPYCFQRGGKENIFYLKPSRFSRLIRFKGKIMEHEQGSCVVLKTIPPIWVYYLFMIVPLTMFVQIPRSGWNEILGYCVFWLLLSGAVTVVNIIAKQIIIEKLQEILSG